MSEDVHKRAEHLLAVSRVEGISPAEREWLTALEAISQAVPPMDAAVKAKDKNTASSGLDTIMQNLNNLHSAFKKRLVLVTGTEAVK